MPYFRKEHIISYQKKTSVILAFLVFCLLVAMPLFAAESIDIIVTGIKGDALKNVKEALTVPAGLVHKGTIDNLWLKRFAGQSGDRVKEALSPFGYYNARVTTAIEQNEKGARLRVRVVPGEPVRLTEVKVAVVGPGKKQKRLARLIAHPPLRKGDVLLQQRYEEYKETLLFRARQLGYLDAKFSLHQIRIAPSATTASILLTMKTGERYYFGATHIQGADRYPETFLRRYLAYSTGQAFSATLLGETQRNFTDSERFKEVTITPEKQKAKAFRIPVTIRLKAVPEISLRPGIGYGTDTGARFTVRYHDLNMFRQGHDLSSDLFISQRLKGLVTGYTLPDSTDIRSSTKLQLNLQKENTTTYTSKIFALELDRNRSFDGGRQGTVYIRAQDEDYSVGTERSTARLLLPGLRFTDNHYDNPVRPHKGFHYAFDLHGTDQMLGSDTALLQLVGQGNYLLPLPWRLSLHTGAKAGMTITNDSIDDIPPSLRFFAGGAQSVRGYSYQSLGPRNNSGKVEGGKQLLTAGIELERALFSDWGVSVFYDAGNAFDSFTNISLFQGAGIGLHYYTTFGAVNLSVAKPLGSGRSALHYYVTVGFGI